MHLALFLLCKRHQMMLLLTLASDHLLLQALLAVFSAHLTSLATMAAFLASLAASLVTLEGHFAFAEILAPSRTLYGFLECPPIFPVF